MTPTVAQIAQNLNNEMTRTGGTGTWSAVAGVQALTSVIRIERNPASVVGLLNIAAGGTMPEVNFQLGTGVLVKAFINSATGEMRLFPAKMFGYPEVDIG
jgi:hypothetical protein